MVVIIVLALWTSLRAIALAVLHVFTHAVQWLTFPDVVRYGACLDCGPARQHRAYELRYGEPYPYGENS